MICRTEVATCGKTDVLIGLAGALLVSWLALVVALLLIRPIGNILREALRILAFPIDLIPDFIPVLGYADDAIIVVAVLRSVVRRVGIDQVRAHWTGTDDGFNALCRAAGLASRPAGDPAQLPS
jgi:uncharacterized membrane protein YkvA (DUF1232 family)